MIFRNLAIQGFKSFRKDSIFRFATNPGFYLLAGQNQLRPQMGPNGCGKTSVWDSLVWALFGKTSRGLKAGAVANWHETDLLCSVLLEFDLDGKEYAVERRWNPNSLVLQEGKDNPQTITQEELEALIRMDYTSFLHTSLMGQFNQFFFDLTPSEKLKVFSDALDLNHWMDTSSEAATLANDYTQHLHAYENDQAKLKGSIQTLEEQSRRIQEEIRHHEENLKIRIDKLKEQMKAALHSKSGIGQEEIHLTQKLKEAETYRRNKDAERDELAKQLEVIRSAASQTSAEISGNRQALTSAQDSLDNITSLGAGCPTCLRPIGPSDRKSIAGVKIQLEKTVSRLSRRRAQFQERHDALIEELKKTTLIHSTFMNEARDLLDRGYKLTSKLELLRSQRESIQRQVDQIKDHIEDERTRPNPHKDQYDRIQKQLENNKEKLTSIEKSILDASFKVDAYKYWSKGFRDIRLWIIEEALLELEININSSLMELGLDGWEIKLDVERPKQDGTMTRGFSVFIKGPDQVADMVPWESWSGGETQRLRIAGAIGLANLIASRRGIHTNIEVWDEPTQHLSGEGINDLLTFFAGRAKQEKKQVWLVDHRSHDAGAFDGDVTIMLDQDGSHVLMK